MRVLRSCLLALAGSMLLVGATGAQASVQSTVSALPTVSAAIAGSIAVSVNAGTLQSLGSVSDNVANSFPSPVNISLTWDLHPSTGAVQVIGYFSDPGAAMISGPVSIPSSWLMGRVRTAGVQDAPTAFTAFTQNAVGGAGMAGGSLSLATQRILGNTKTGTLTFDLELQLDLTGRVLTPGAYSGILNIRAVTQ